MDKVFITKDELAKQFTKKTNSTGPFLTALVMLWLFVGIIWLLPTIVFACMLLILYIPFYFIDQSIIRRRNNG